MSQESTVGFQSIHRPFGGPRTRPSGAVFLLSVYFVAVTLLLLGGISMQRTSVEVRAAQLSRDAQQAFWLAEGGLDQAIRNVQAQPLAVTEGPSEPFTVPGHAGATYSYSVTRNADDPTILHLTGRGTILGATTQQINATVQVGDTFREGLYAAENVILYYEPQLPNNYMQVTGPVRAGRGTVASLLVQNTTIDGRVTIGLPSPSANPWGFHGGYDILGPNSNPYPAYNSPEMQGFYVPYSQGAFWNLRKGSGIQTSMRIPGPPQALTSYDGNPFSSAPTASPLHFPKRRDLAGYDAMITPSTVDQYCRSYSSAASVTNGAMLLRNDQEVTISDGHPLDLTGAGDGRILLCQRSITLMEESQLTFTAPTTIYLIDNQGFDQGYVTGIVYWQSGRAQMQAMTGERKLKNGIEVVVPDWASGYQRDADRYLGHDRSPASLCFTGVASFPGSIWAPTSKVHMEMFEKPHRGEERVTPTRIIAGYIAIGSSLRPAPVLTFRAEPSDGAPYTSLDAVSVLSWTQ